ncbi:MAG: hypothetical protein V4649_00015 [Bacteroidota bacterium]
MKRIKTILVAAITGAALFAGCRKSDIGLNNASAYQATTTPAKDIPGDYALVGFNLLMLPSQQGDMIKWEAGTLNAGMIMMDATKEVGNALKLVNFFTELRGGSYKLYGPLTVGHVAVPPARYMEHKFTVKLNPQGTDAALHMYGKYYIADAQASLGKSIRPETQVAVNLVIDQPIELVGYYKAPLVLALRDQHTITLYIDPAVMTGGITKQMLLEAKKTHSVVLISSTENPQLYKYIINNLAKVLRVKVESKGTLPSA